MADQSVDRPTDPPSEGCLGRGICESFTGVWMGRCALPPGLSSTDLCPPTSLIKLETLDTRCGAPLRPPQAGSGLHLWPIDRSTGQQAHRAKTFVAEALKPFTGVGGSLRAAAWPKLNRLVSTDKHAWAVYFGNSHWRPPS